MDGLDLSSILVILFVLFFILLVVTGTKSVPQGREYTVERFGRYTKTLHPGLNLIVPLIDRIGARMNMMEQVLDVPTQEIITKDNAMVAVDGVVFYQVLDSAKALSEQSDLLNQKVNEFLKTVREM